MDFEKKKWIIPVEHSKNGVSHTIFLSEFALKQFTELKKQATSKVWCFPANTEKTLVCTKSTTKQIRDRQMAGQNCKPIKNRAKNADGLLLTGGDWVPHDLRRTGATLMQLIKVEPAIKERVLNNVEPSKLIRTYQTDDYAEEKRDAWKRLGNKLRKLCITSSLV